MKKILLSALAVLLTLSVFASAKPKVVSVTSPDGQVEVKVIVGDDIRYDVVSHGQTLMKANKLAMKLRNRTGYPHGPQRWLCRQTDPSKIMVTLPFFDVKK